MARHQRLRGRSGNAPERNEWYDGKHHPSAAGESETCEAEDAEEQAGKQAAAFAKALHERANQDAGHHGRGDAYHCE